MMEKFYALFIYLYLIDGLYAHFLIKVLPTGLGSVIKLALKIDLAFGEVFNEIPAGLTVHFQCELDISIDVQSIHQRSTENLEDEANGQHYLVLSIGPGVFVRDTLEAIPEIA